MTEKLYLKDSYIFSCETVITEIIVDDTSISVAFLHTPFFAGGGGQPSDCGYVNGVYAKDAYEIDGIVYHRLNCKEFPYKVGDNVTVSVCEDIRLERMRAHTGEHILSGVAHNMFGVENVGFHMDENGLMTVDFDKYLDNSKLQLLEENANRCVMDNAEIKINTYAVDDTSQLDFRSKIDFTDDVRIVEISGVDKCACCAPHLRFTGEVGLIKILSSASHRGGVRITLICGRNSYVEFEKRYRQILDISALLCSKYDEVVESVAGLIDNNKSLKYEKEQIRNELLITCAANIQPDEVVFEFYEKLSADELRIINNALADKCKYISLLFSGNDTVGYSYCVYSDRLNLDKFARDLKNSLNGSGGGRGTMIQGKLKASKDDIVRFINEMKVENYENAQKEASGGKTSQM